MIHDKKLLDLAKTLAIEAGKIIMEVFNREEKILVSEKADLSPVTEADQRANDFIVAGLLAGSSFPIISEESGVAPWSERKLWEYCWIVDPLDGTKSFVRKESDFTVNIGLVHLGKPLLGVVFVPFTGELFSASWSVEACLEQVGHDGKIKEGSSRKLTPATIPGNPSEIKFAASKNHFDATTEAYIAKYPGAGLVNRGSSLKFMLLAEGKAHIYPRFGPCMEWDTCAAHAILSLAGGCVEMIEGNELVYNKEDLHNPHFIAYGMKNQHFTKTTP